MKRITLFILILFTLSGCNMSYESIEEAVQSQWKTPIKVVNQDKNNQLVYYFDQSQHILGTYQYENGKYRYDNEQSIGTVFDSESGLPFLLSANHFDGVGEIIHGAIKTEQEVDRFVIEYKCGEKQEIQARNNTFITEFPSYLTIDADGFFGEVENAYAYDKNNEIIESWK
ncbi:membrane lipoprotein lipid attachment site-containing protein [Mesobacillus jeotgali]|uniref:membrane lipoprotein lipid attachment site-containing protein n=1 Tax=Mesobacillus jeotgali TaxID=129985 RepID=UPI001CFECDF6|nr:membrane lipoprotein lipid attachment site-containing protein [Mesobacillus jeotgali]